MRVFVAGATGVLGRRAVARLVAAGHQVTGVARSPEKAALLESLGARPVGVDLFDADAVRGAVARARRGRQSRHQDPARRGDGAHIRVGGERAHPPRGVGQSRRRRDRGRCHRVRAGVARVPLRRARRRVARRRVHALDPLRLQRFHAGGRGERRAVPRARRTGSGVALRPVLRTGERPDHRDDSGRAARSDPRRRVPRLRTRR